MKKMEMHLKVTLLYGLELITTIKEVNKHIVIDHKAKDWISDTVVRGCIFNKSCQ
jgi:hypothetical protein